MAPRRITRTYRRPSAANKSSESASPRTTSFASLVDLLCIVNECDISILPVQSHKALGILGRGLSGSIEQSQADVHTTFAFKVGVPSKIARDTEWSHDWAALITQIMIMRHEPVRTNLHFTDLVGVCFYIDRGEGPIKRAWPLLVSLRASRGDLARFLLQEQEGLLTEEIRLQLFSEAIEAVCVLHACGVSHGDIKPENFLVDQFEGDCGELNLLLTDFSSSLIRGQRRVPATSQPWCAPELGDVVPDLEFDEMAQYDIFALGLVCLHLLVPIQLLEASGIYLLGRLDSRGDGRDTMVNAFIEAKAHGNITSISRRMIEALEQSALPKEHRTIVSSVLSEMIEPNAGQRSIPLSQLQPYIEQYLSDHFLLDVVTKTQPQLHPYKLTLASHPTHGCFELSDILSDLDDLDYVVRVTLANDLRHKAASSACSLCRQQYAFQYALCLRFGFGGVNQCDSEVVLAEYLLRSGKSTSDLDIATTEACKKYHFSFNLARDVADALSIGQIVCSTRSDEYHASGRLQTACQILEKEISTRTLALPEPEHLCTIRLRWDLALSYKATNRLKEAKCLQEGVIRGLSEYCKDDRASILLAKAVLASILADQRQLSRAIELYTDIYPDLCQILGDKHPDVVTVAQLHGICLLGAGCNADAALVLEKVVALRETLLSPQHPETIRAEICLVSALRQLTLLQDALSVARGIESKISQKWSEDDLLVVELYITKAMLCKELHILEEANSAILHALRRIDRLKLPENDSHRLSAQEAQASILGALGKFSQQEILLNKLLDIHESEGDTNNALPPWQLRLALAECLLAQRRFAAVRDVAGGVMAQCHSHIAEDGVADYLLRSAGIMAVSYSRQHEPDKAFEVLRQTRSICLQEFGIHRPASVEATISLSQCLVKHDRHEDARHYCEQLLSMAHDTFKPKAEEHETAKEMADASVISSISHADALRLMAQISMRAGELDHAKSYCAQALELTAEAFGEDHPQTLSLKDLACEIDGRVEQSARSSLADLDSSVRRLEENTANLYVEENGRHIRPS